MKDLKKRFTLTSLLGKSSRIGKSGLVGMTGMGGKRATQNPQPQNSQSSLELWQLQMKALQRASEPRQASPSELETEPSSLIIQDSESSKSHTAPKSDALRK